MFLGLFMDNKRVELIENDITIKPSEILLTWDFSLQCVHAQDG